jgi:hypothetical protein
MRKELKEENVAPPQGETKKLADTFKEGIVPPKDDEGSVQPIQPVKKAKGGMAKSASARADGCAIRGKTRA